VPPGVVTVTSTVPADSGGEVTVRELSLVTVTPVAGMLPKSTTVAPVNPEPDMVTEVAPVVKPVEGATLLTTGVEGQSVSIKV
jgi:hypothetical protein